MLIWIYLIILRGLNHKRGDKKTDTNRKLSDQTHEKAANKTSEYFKMSKSDAHLNNKSLNNLNIINKTADVSLIYIIFIFFLCSLFFFIKILIMKANIWSKFKNCKYNYLCFII